MLSTYAGKGFGDATPVGDLQYLAGRINISNLKHDAASEMLSFILF